MSITFDSYNQSYILQHRCVTVSILASSAIDPGFEYRSGPTGWHETG